MKEVLYRYIDKNKKALRIKRLYVDRKEEAWDAVKKVVPKANTFSIDYVRECENLLLKGKDQANNTVLVDVRNKEEAEEWAKELKLTSPQLMTEEQYLQSFELVNRWLDNKGREK